MGGWGHWLSSLAMSHQAGLWLQVSQQELLPAWSKMHPGEQPGKERCSFGMRLKEENRPCWLWLQTPPGPLGHALGTVLATGSASERALLFYHKVSQSFSGNG